MEGLSAEKRQNMVLCGEKETDMVF